MFKKGSVNSDVYRIRIIPIINAIISKHIDDLIFRQQPLIMQDNASIHKARQTVALL